jgi:DNA polymerase III epsilon subunit-like protein
MDLLLDTETTGFAPKGCNDPADPRQPHAVQIALAHRERSTGRLVNAAKFILNPKGDWTMPPGAEAIHGISRTQCTLQGIPADKGLALFRIMASISDRLVAHNIDYDWSILQALAYRSNVGFESLPKYTRFCTMEATRSVCKLPPTERMIQAGIKGYKAPKLIEAYKIMVDPKGFDKAHDAFADLSAMNAILNVLEGIAAPSSPSPQAA